MKIATPQSALPRENREFRYDVNALSVAGIRDAPAISSQYGRDLPVPLMMREAMHRVYAVTANLETFCRQRSLKSRKRAVAVGIYTKTERVDSLCPRDS